MKKALYAASTAGHLTAFHLPWLRALHRDGWTVHTAAAGPFSCPDVQRHFDLPFTKSMTAPKNLAAAWQVRGLLRRERYDLICVNTSLAAFFVRLGVLLAGKGKARVVNVVHGYLFDQSTPAPRRRLLLGAEQLTAGVTDAVAVMNRQDLEIARAHRLAREPAVLLPGIGLDPAPYRPATAAEKQAARAALGISDAAFVLLYAAEFSARKNQSFLVSALAGLPEDTLLLLPGQGQLLETVRDQARALGLERRVLLPGYVTDVPQVCRAADLAVSASRSEGLPFNLMEAMAAGLCPAASAVKGHEDLIEPEVTGLLYPYGDEAAFAAAVGRLRGDPALRRRLGLQARQRVLERYTQAQVEPIYLPLLEGDA